MMDKPEDNKSIAQHFHNSTHDIPSKLLLVILNFRSSNVPAMLSFNFQLLCMLFPLLKTLFLLMWPIPVSYSYRQTFLPPLDWSRWSLRSFGCIPMAQVSSTFHGTHHRIEMTCFLSPYQKASLGSQTPHPTPEIIPCTYYYSIKCV